jgi:hypothetical protein
MAASRLMERLGPAWAPRPNLYDSLRRLPDTGADLPPADTPATALLVTSLGANQRQRRAGAPVNLRS